MSATEPIARQIDHALLHPTMTDQEMREGCELAARLGVKSVCVKPYAVPLAVEALRGSETVVGTVIGFPSGSHPTEVKVAEAEWAMAAGAVELDMVVNVGKVLQGDWDFVRRDIEAVASAAHKRGALLKVIFETDYVTKDEDKRRLCEVSEAAGADFVKTSTGFGFVKQPSGDYNYVGATSHDIALMRASCSPKVGVKASGGVRSHEQAVEYRKLGATRLGTSASAVIIKGAGKDSNSY
ncbi:MAG: deoxyribose-phosphate aldolase [Planctomycetota bacterium]